MGQLTRAAKHDPENMSDPVAMGLQASEEILKGLGMRKPPAILQYKMAQALGHIAEGNTNPIDPADMATFDPASEFYKR